MSFSSSQKESSSSSRVFIVRVTIVFHRLEFRLEVVEQSGSHSFCRHSNRSRVEHLSRTREVVVFLSVCFILLLTLWRENMFYDSARNPLSSLTWLLLSVSFVVSQASFYPMSWTLRDPFLFSKGISNHLQLVLFLWRFPRNLRRVKEVFFIKLHVPCLNS